MSEATDPPPEVVPREYWEIWYAACRLLEENADLTILVKVGDNSDDEWHNSGVQTVFVDRRNT